MAENKVVTTSFQRDLKLFAEQLDQELNGLQLVMIFQKKMALGTGAWTLCVCADELDDMSERAALAFVLDKVKKSAETVTSAIERVIVLHAYDPALADLLLDVTSIQDSRLLIGRSVFDRRIARARLLFFRPLSDTMSRRQSLTA